MSPHTPVVAAMRGSTPPSPAEPVPQTNEGRAMVTRGTRIGFTFLGGFNISHQAQGAALIPTTSLAEVTEGKRICISNLDCEQVKIGHPKATVYTVSAPVSTAENSGGGFGESHMAPY